MKERVKGGIFIRMRPCPVCRHPALAKIDRALSLRTLTGVEVAAIVGCSEATVSRHRHQHMIPTAAETVKMTQDVAELADLDILAEIRGLYGRMLSALAAAEQKSNWRAVQAFATEARRDLELLAKILRDIQGMTASDPTDYEHQLEGGTHDD